MLLTLCNCGLRIKYYQKFKHLPISSHIKNSQLQVTAFQLLCMIPTRIPSTKKITLLSPSYKLFKMLTFLLPLPWFKGSMENGTRSFNLVVLIYLSNRHDVGKQFKGRRKTLQLNLCESSKMLF